MTLFGLIRAYACHHAILTYMAVGLGALLILARYPVPGPRAATVVLVVLVFHPLAWHLQHRFILHSQWPYKIRWLAATWKRLHYDHHQNPTLMEGLLGPVNITLPVVGLSSMAVGTMIGETGTGWAGRRWLWPRGWSRPVTMSGCIACSIWRSGRHGAGCNA
jgi:hypothetical protein